MNIHCHTNNAELLCEAIHYFYIQNITVLNRGGASTGAALAQGQKGLFFFSKYIIYILCSSGTVLSRGRVLTNLSTNMNKCTLM